jgi:hypothetical protein
MDWWIGPSNPTHDLWKWNDYHSFSHWKSCYSSCRKSEVGACHKLFNLWVLLCMQEYCCCIMWLHLPLHLHGYIYGEQKPLFLLVPFVGSLGYKIGVQPWDSSKWACHWTGPIQISQSLPNVTFNPMTPQIVSFSISFPFQLQVYSLVKKWTLNVVQVVFVTAKYRN